jgi:hypothetical protein
MSSTSSGIWPAAKNRQALGEDLVDQHAARVGMGRQRFHGQPVRHPYQGNNYFTAGRANGLDFWESSALTAFGSATWEFFGETARPSLNDFVNTTLGGIALGEMFHRTAWLVRNTHATGKVTDVERNRRDGHRPGHRLQPHTDWRLGVASPIRRRSLCRVGWVR